MLNRFIQAKLDIVRQKAGKSAACAMSVHRTMSGLLRTAHHTVLILGIFAIAALGIMFVNPASADRLLALSPFAEKLENKEDNTSSSAASLTDMPAQAVASHAAADKLHNVLNADQGDGNAISRQQAWVTAWLSKRYRVASDATNMLVSAAYMTAKEIKLDPLLILSVMAIESRFNPFAESPVGAQGLMQVMSKVHQDKFAELGGTKAALNPVANIKVGSLILKDYVKRGGSVEAGLKLYVGAGALQDDAGYGAKVLAEYQRLRDVAMGKKVPIYSIPATAAPAKPRAQENRNDAPVPGEGTPAGDDKMRHLADADQFASL